VNYFGELTDDFGILTALHYQDTEFASKEGNLSSKFVTFMLYWVCSDLMKVLAGFF
jgi:hypothetical protein